MSQHTPDDNIKFDEGHIEIDFSSSQKVLRELIQKVIDNGFPEGVDLFNLNVPSNYESPEVKITSLAHKMLDKHVIDNTDEEKAEIFNHPLDENQYSDDLIMIASDLVSEYDKGTDGYALLVEKRPSLTPLNVNMTSKDLKDWY